MIPPRVSVIVPNYNHARFLNKRIDSILAQTFTDFELLLMDDCSTDDSRAVLQAYAGHPRTRLLLNDTNSGSTFRQWRKGIAETTGPYIWIAESDDFADPTLLQRLVDQLDRYPNVGVAYCESNVIDEDDTPIRTTHADFLGVGDGSRYRTDFVADGRRECAHYLSQQNMIPNASAVVFRRDVYLAAGKADDSMRLCADWKLWARMLLRSDLAHVAEPLNFYRSHAANVRSGTLQWRSMLEMTRVVGEIQRAVTVPPEQLRCVRNWLADKWINAWLHRQLVEPGQRADVLRELKSFDPAFTFRVAARAARRSLSVAGKGRIRHWFTHLLQPRPAPGSSTPSAQS